MKSPLRPEKPSPDRGIAITGHALANVLGNSTGEVLDRIFRGEGRFRAPSATFPLNFETVVGEMRDLPVAPELGAFDQSRLLRISMLAARELAPAVAKARSRFGPERLGFVFGGCTGGMQETERVYEELAANVPAPGYAFDAQHPLDAGLKTLSRFFEIEGPSMVISTACSSSAKAMATAHRWIEADLVDAVIVGGADSLCLMTLYGFNTLGAMSPVATRPFSKDRDGLTLGEGAGFVLLERDARAAVYSVGVGETSDAYHLSSPSPDGKGIVLAMKMALDRAGITPREVGHVNAHGTGTRHNDLAEGLALAALFGPDLPITSTKSLTGHLLGAAGVTEIIIAIETLMRRTIPPTVGSLPQDPMLDIRVVREPTPLDRGVVVTNSLGFGGTNTSVVLVS